MLEVHIQKPSWSLFLYKANSLVLILKFNEVVSAVVILEEGG